MPRSIAALPAGDVRVRRRRGPAHLDPRERGCRRRLVEAEGAHDLHRAADAIAVRRTAMSDADLPDDLIRK